MKVWVDKDFLIIALLLQGFLGVIGLLVFKIRSKLIFFSVFHV
jgi:hypothetical protein